MFSAASEREPTRRAPLGWTVGAILIAVAAICGGVVAALPAPYVIEQPGPTFDVLGDTEVSGEDVPLISIPGETTHPTDGSLRMLTVYASEPDRLPSWLDVVAAYLNPRNAVLPVEAVYAPGTTQEQNAEQATLDMENSQKEAVAAALAELDYDLDATLTVHSLTEDSASEGILEAGDVITSINGVALTSVDQLRDEIGENGTERPARLVVERNGAEQTVEVTPRLVEDAPVLGILVASDYRFPFTVKIQLENVGGPSAGLMFALGIYDKLTEGSLTGGQDIAGTGTIDATGAVGPIGGIRQKLWGADDAGADYFLAPSANCDEVVGHIPDGLTVAAVSTLDDALAALETIRDGGDLSALPSCG